MAQSIAPEMNSYEFRNYSARKRGAFVNQLKQLGFQDDIIHAHLDVVDSDIRNHGFGGCVLLNLCVTPPRLVTLSTPMRKRG